jgi:hypothetical protein
MVARQMIFAAAGVFLLSGAAQAQTTASPTVDGQMAQPAPADGTRAQPRRNLIAKLSPEGRAILRAEMRENTADRQSKQAARTAEPYNTNALRSAFDDERKVADEQQKQQHQRMLIVAGKLSPADRKVFADSMSEAEERVAGMRQKMQQRESNRRGNAPN